VALVAEPEPNWLLSTTTQSSAALVAIVGGFLLSRVLALAAERNGLALGEAQLSDEVKLASETGCAIVSSTIAATTVRYGCRFAAFPDDPVSSM
jgi:hypothetical protein